LYFSSAVGHVHKHKLVRPSEWQADEFDSQSKIGCLPTARSLPLKKGLRHIPLAASNNSTPVFRRMEASNGADATLLVALSVENRCLRSGQQLGEKPTHYTRLTSSHFDRYCRKSRRKRNVELEFETNESGHMDF